MEHRHSLAGPVKLWDTQRRFQVAFLREHGLKPHHLLLDFGCGPLRGGIPVINYLNAGNYHGVDINQESIEEARKELRENHLEHKLPRITHIKNTDAVRIALFFDVIWAFSVVIHMPDDTFEEFLEFCSTHLKRGGVLYMNVNIGERRTGGRFLDFDTYIRPLQFYKATTLKHNLTIVDSEPCQEQTMLKAMSLRHREW